MIPVRGLVAFHQGINDTAQHQQATVDAGSLTLLLALSTRLGQALAACMNSNSCLWGATVPTQADKVVKRRPEKMVVMAVRIAWCMFISLLTQSAPDASPYVPAALSRHAMLMYVCNNHHEH